MLVVDDHAMVRQGIVSLFISHKDVTRVGEDAIRQAAVPQPDVVIMDIIMPKLNGIQATEHLIRENPTMRIIGLSVHDDTNVIGRLKSAGTIAFVTKSSVADQEG